MFVDKKPVPVTDTEGENTIFIRPKMDYGTKQKVIGAAAVVTVQGEAEVDVGAYQTALLVHNVVRWEGPAFKREDGKPIACTPENIEALDPDEPLVLQVLEEIAKRNPPPSADPKLSEPAGLNGSTGAKEAKRAKGKAHVGSSTGK